MSKFYRHVLKPTLAGRIRALLEETSIVEQLDVSDELALMRDNTALRVKLYSDLVEAAETNPAVTMENLVAAGQIMQAGLQDVMRAAELMAKVEKLKLEVANGFAAAMNAVITSVVHAAQESFENDHRVAIFEQKLREEIFTKAQLGPQGLNVGTDLTPDMDVSEMDSSVPRVDSQEVQTNPTPVLDAQVTELVDMTERILKADVESHAGDGEEDFELG